MVDNCPKMVHLVLVRKRLRSNCTPNRASIGSFPTSASLTRINWQKERQIGRHVQVRGFLVQNSSDDLTARHWLDSNFIPMDSKKFGFLNFDYIIRFTRKNESEIEKLRSRDLRIFEKNRFYEIETLTHNIVNTVSDKRNWTDSSDSTCNLVLLSEV